MQAQLSVSVRAYECVCLPGAILCTAVDVGPVIQQVLDYGEPAAGACLMESTVTGVVSVVHLTYSVLQTVQNNLLKTAHTEGKSRVSCVRLCVHVFTDTGTNSVPPFPNSSPTGTEEGRTVCVTCLLSLTCALGLVWLG